MNLIHIQTSLRLASIWVDGYERAAGAAYLRSVGEVVYAIWRA